MRRTSRSKAAHSNFILCDMTSRVVHYSQTFRREMANAEKRF